MKTLIIALLISFQSFSQSSITFVDLSKYLSITEPPDNGIINLEHNGILHVMDFRITESNEYAFATQYMHIPAKSVLLGVKLYKGRDITHYTEIRTELDGNTKNYVIEVFRK